MGGKKMHFESCLAVKFKALNVFVCGCSLPDGMAGT
jgi:hypothetical protein